MRPAAKLRLPVWALGLANTPTGFVYGFISTAMGILLVARGVSVARVGAISAIAFSPCFWAWMLAPILDLRFTRRTWAFLFIALSAGLLAAAVLSIGNLTLFTVLLTASCTAVVLYSNAVGGMIPDLVGDEAFDTVSAWSVVANLGAAGIFSALVIGLLRSVSLRSAVAVLVVCVLAPAVVLLPLFPRPPKPEGALAQNFAAMARDVRRVVHKGRIWVGLLIFLVPVGGFALTNLFSTLGAEFHTSERAVTVLNGPLVAVVCSAGCLLAIPLCRRWRRRTVYLASGTVAALVSGAMGLLPRTAVVYAVGLLAYNLMQGFNYTAMLALEFDIVGPRNAVAGTMLAMMTASANVPISGMTYVDSRVHDAHGLGAMFFVDCISALITVLVLVVVLLPMLDRTTRRRTLQQTVA